MKSRPVIGISAPHDATGRSLILRETYVNAVIRAGGLPVILPQSAEQQFVDEMLEHIDALLLSGGGDIDPVHFGDLVEPECNPPDPSRDAFELLITSRARARKMPVFGICRGVQVLCVVYGGKLIQDIEKATGIPRANHHQQEPFSQPHHTVRLTHGGLFERIVGAASMEANSIHHQAIKMAGEGLRVEGASDDGIIECVCDEENEGIFGVQFHPELMAGEYAPAQRLFDHFIQCAKKYQNAK